MWEFEDNILQSKPSDAKHCFSFPLMLVLACYPIIHPTVVSGCFSKIQTYCGERDILSFAIYCRKKIINWLSNYDVIISFAIHVSLHYFKSSSVTVRNTVLDLVCRFSCFGKPRCKTQLQCTPFPSVNLINLQSTHFPIISMKESSHLWAPQLSWTPEPLSV